MTKHTTTRLKTNRTTTTLTVTYHTAKWASKLLATAFSSSPQPPAQPFEFKKRAEGDEIWALLTHGPSISMLCHCLSTPILIRVMWFYKVAVRRGDEATNRSGCLTSRGIATTHPGAGSLIGGPAERYWVVRKRVISEHHLPRWWWLCHTNTCTLTHNTDKQKIEMGKIMVNMWAITALKWI